MSRNTAVRRRCDVGAAGRAGLYSLAVASAGDDRNEQGERMSAENARIRDELSEVEGWYRLLQAEHSTLQGRLTHSGRRMTDLQADANRLAVENRELHALVSRSVPGVDDRAGDRGQVEREPGQAPSEGEGEDFVMRRIFDWIRSVQRHKWATAALVTIATLLGRDPGVQGVLGSAVSRAREAFNSSASGSDGRARVDSGFLRYAAMIQSREQLERARREYNENESRLKGDALLEAQDRLRAARVRDRQARRAFLPELSRQCEQAGMPIPREASEALATLNTETVD